MRPAARALLALAAAFAAATPLGAQQRVSLPARDRALTLNTRTLFQVGKLEGEEYENFAGVTDVAFDHTGNLYVLDATAYRVVVFDARGRYFRTIGRQGDGPGEFGFPSAIALLPGGELVVNDAAKSNLQIFGPDGTFLRTVVVAEELGRAAGRMRTSPKGGLITETFQLQRLVSQADGGAPPPRMQVPARAVTRLTIGDRASGQRLFNAPPRNLQLATPKSAAGGVHVSMSITAFEPALLWSPTPDGGVAALNAAPYRITLIDAQGRPTRVLERAIQPRKATKADRKRFLENQKQGMAGGMGGGVAMIAFAARDPQAAGGHAAGPTNLRVSSVDIKESDVTWNDVIPVISGLGTDSFGRLWVQRSGPDLGDGPIDIIDANTSYLGTLAKQQLPRAFGPGGRLAYVIKDDLDVQRVVVKQLLR